MTARRDPSAGTTSGPSTATATTGLAVGALLLALIGCGGTGGSRGTTTTSTTSGTTSTTSGSTAGSTAVLNLPNTPGQVQVTFLTGAGRAAGDRTAVVRRVALDDNDPNTPLEETRLQGEYRLVLNRYSSQILPLNVATYGPSRLFTSFEFDVLQFLVEDDNGAGGTTTATYNQIENIPAVIPANIRTFPGRTTHVPFFLDQDTIVLNSSGAPTFDINRFNAINFRAEDQNTLRGQLADYVSFDISNMSASARPTLANGSTATRVLFSGDGYLIADGDPYQGAAVNVEPILPSGQTDVLIGRLSGPQTLPSQGGTPADTPGTYSLVQADPSDVNSTLPRRITSLQGTWKEHFRQKVSSTGGVRETGYLSSVGSFVALTIPSSDDDGRQDMIAVTEDMTTNSDGTARAKVTNCYFGYIDLDTNRFFLYPIKNLYPTDTGVNLQGEVSGTISGFTYSGVPSNSTVKSGQFSFTTGAPSGFPSSGRFLVLRN